MLFASVEHKKLVALSARGAEYTNYFSEGGKTPHPKCVLDTSLNNLMVRFQ